MAKERWITLVIGTLVGSMLLGGAGYASSKDNPAQVKMPEAAQSVNVQLNNKNVVTFQYDNDYYVPLRRIAATMNQDVEQGASNRVMNAKQSVQSLEYEEVLLEEAPQSVQDWVLRSLDHTLGQAYQHDDGYTYILVTRGWQPSGGYAVEIENIVCDEWGTWIHSRESNPNNDQFVTAEVTYPYSLVRVDELPSGNIYFINSEGGRIPSLPGILYLHSFAEETDNIILFEPVRSEDEITLHGVIRSFTDMAYITHTDSDKKDWIEMAEEGWTYFSKTMAKEKAAAIEVTTFSIDGNVETLAIDPS